MFINTEIAKMYEAFNAIKAAYIYSKRKEEKKLKKNKETQI